MHKMQPFIEGSIKFESRNSVYARARKLILLILLAITSTKQYILNKCETNPKSSVFISARLSYV